MTFDTQSSKAIRPFVLVGTQRSGSTFLRHCLDSHPQIRCHGELFKRNYPHPEGYYAYVQAKVGRRLRHLLARRSLVRDYLHWLYAGADREVVGFKLMYSHISHMPPRFPMLIDFIRSSRLRVVHITRHNVLKTYVSRMVTRKSGVYHAKQTPRPVSVTLPTGRVLEALGEIDDVNGRWRALFGDALYLDLEYEAFVADRDAQSRRLLCFLGVDEEQPLSSRNVKLNPNDLRDIVDNYDELSAALTGTKYEWCLGGEVR